MKAKQDSTVGTPSTLSEAITNGLFDATGKLCDGLKPEAVIESHVLQFLRQQFNAAYLEADGESAHVLQALHRLALRLGIGKDSA